MNPAFLRQLSTITSVNDVSKIEKLFHLTTASDSDIGDERDLESFKRMVHELEDLRQELSNLYKFIDRDLDRVLQRIHDVIVDAHTARIALDIYTPHWFRDLPMSISAKQEIANVLNKALSTHLDKVSPFWTDIVDAEPNVIQSIRYMPD